MWQKKIWQPLPESPDFTLSLLSPLAKSILSLTSSKCKVAYCKIEGAFPVSEIPFPIARTGASCMNVVLQANGMGLIYSLISTGDGSLINAISLKQFILKCELLNSMIL